jgi:hypothetical protein
MIKNITLDELRRMRNTEGLILQGCGGDPQGWLDGINGLLTERGILKDGEIFKDISVFEHNGCTNILFHMDDVKLNIERLALWRLESHSIFYGTWLSDYLPNRLGVNMDEPIPEEQQKPESPIIGADGNIFNIMGIAAQTLKKNGMAEEAKEMRSRITESGSYDSALAIIMEYVEPVSVDGQEQSGMMMEM